MYLIWDKYILRFLIFALLFMDIFSPAENMRIKIIIALIMSCVSLFYVLKGKMKVKMARSIFLWFLIFIASGLFFTILSVLYENRQPTSFFNVYVVEPCIYLCLALLINEEEIIYIYNLMKDILLFVLLYNIVYALSINGALPLSLAEHMPYVKANIGGVSISGIIKITSQNISWLFFLLPCYFCEFIISSKMDLKLLMIFVAGLINVLLFLRTALILCIISVPFIILAGAVLTGTKLNNKNIIILICIIGIGGVTAVVSDKIDMEAVWEKVSVSFSKKTYVNQYGISDNGGMIRYDQIRDLLQTWICKPLFGWGDGAESFNIIRSDVVGAYEMTYFAMLMQRGIIGMGIFVLQIVWIYFRGIWAIPRSKKYGSILFCVLVGYSSFLLANMTNPYFQSFDRLIIIFFPLFIINNILNSNDHKFGRLINNKVL